MEEDGPANRAPPSSDLNALSSELTGVLATVLGSLNDRVQTLEVQLSSETAGKKAAEKALEETTARLQQLEFKLDEVHQTQQRLNDASSSLEAQFESGLADMLTRVKKTEDETAQLKAEEEKARAELEAKMEEKERQALEKEKQARGEKNLGKLRANTQKIAEEHKKKSSVDATINLVQDAATRAREEAAKKRQQGDLIKEWTAMIEARLKAVEDRPVFDPASVTAAVTAAAEAPSGDDEVATAEVAAAPTGSGLRVVPVPIGRRKSSGIDAATAEDVAAKAAAKAAEEATTSLKATMLDELSAQVAARVSGQITAAVTKGVKEHGKEAYDTALVATDAVDARLRAAMQQSASFEQLCNERIAALRSVSHDAAMHASQALSKVQENSASAAEMQSIRERHETLHRDLVSLRSASASKCERETLEDLKSSLESEITARLSALESRLTAERDDSVSAVKQLLLEKIESGLKTSEGTFEASLTSRLSLLDSQISRKLDSGKEYEKMIEVAIADGTTSKRLKMIESQMAHLLRLIQQLVDVKPPPSPVMPGNDASLSPSTYAIPTPSPAQRKLPPAATRAAVLHERPRREQPILAHSGSGIMSSFPSQNLIQHRPPPNTPVRPASAGNMRHVDSAPALGPQASIDGSDAFVPIRRPTSAKPTQPERYGHTRIFAAVRTTTPSNSPTKMLNP